MTAATTQATPASKTSIAAGTRSATASSSPDPEPSTQDPQPARPTPGEWSGDLEGVLAFVAFREVHQEIFIKDLPDGDERNLTNNPAEDFDPDISDDGTRIAFISSRSGNAQAFLVNPDGSGLVQLTDDGLGAQQPRFSRDGAMIAYSRGGSVAVVPVGGGEPRTLMESQPEDTADPCRAGAFVGGWSPDDRTVTYYSASVSREEAQVCTVSIDGGDPTVVVGGPGIFAVEPVFSPDGEYIAHRGIVDGQHDIWVVHVPTGDRFNLTNDIDLDIEPEWSPDGQWIAYGSLRPSAGQFDLYAMRPDGTDPRQITTDPTKEANPVWAP